MFKHTLPIMLLGLALSWPAEAARSYGPVKEQDTLWNIATQLRPDNKATVQQTMLAIFYKNPQAFASNNINSLMKGAVIKAPSSAEARRYQRIDALREARKHNNYWKRGSNLPKITPPPVPKIKESKASKRSKQAVAKTTVSYTATPKNTNRRLAKLQAQLQAAETKNQQLSAELTALQAKQNPNKPNPKLDAQVKKLKIELQELTTVLDQKDNHIKTLQSSLKNASETIKAQHADNMRLYDKLKEVSPNSVPAPPSSEGKSELKLSTVEAATAAVAGAAAGKAATEAANKAETKAADTATSTKPTASTETENKTAASSEAKDATAQSVWADEKNATEANQAVEGSESKASATPSDATNTNKPTAEPQTLAAAVPSTSATQATTSTTPPEKSSSDTAKPTDPAEAATANKPADKTATEKAGTDPAKTADKTEAKTATDQPADSTSKDTTSKSASQATDTNSAATAKPTDKTEVKTTEAPVKAEDGKGGAASKSPATANNEPASDIKAPSTASGASSTPANDVKTASSVPVSQMLAQSGNQGGASGEKASPASSTPLRGVSPLAMAVALISLLFILALVWRAVLQQRDMRRLEDEEARVAERMRKRLEDNQATVPTSATLVDKKDPETEIKF